MTSSTMPIRRLFPLMAAAIFVASLVTGIGAYVTSQRAGDAQDALIARVDAQSAVDRVAFLGERVQFFNVVKGFVVGAAADAQNSMTGDLAEIERSLAAAGKLPISAEEKAAVTMLDRSYQGLITFLAQARPPRTAAETAASAAAYGKATGVVTAATEKAQATIVRHREAEERRVSSAVRDSLLLVLALCALSGLLVAGALAAFGRNLSRRLADVVTGLGQVAEGNLTVELPAAGRDEVAGISRSVNEMTGRLRGVFARIAEASTRLGTASSSLEDTAARVGRSAQEASSEAEQVSRSADEVSQNVQAVAAGSEEMGASITEIAQNANEAARVATGAVAAVESTTGTMNQLGESSREIGDVVRLITSIAEQTNLLALNATIEAARAGDAGKGFAVVADEVKQLAQETARATEDISKRVEAIQEDADQAGRAIADIAGVITRINEFQTTIASAVEEQTATTQAINAGVADAAQGSERIARTISGVAGVTGETASSMSTARESARELSAMSLELERLVIGFRY